MKVVEFPDGRRHRFIGGSTGWRITHMYTAASTVNVSTGIPSDNWVWFEYPVGTNDTKVSDSHGRVHWIRMATPDRISNIELSAFSPTGGPAAASYTLNYENVLNLSMPCTDPWEPAAHQNVYLMSGVTPPVGEKWAFDYNKEQVTCDDFAGTLTEATLPTKGVIRWEWTDADNLDGPRIARVSARKRFLRDRVTQDSEKTYATIADGMAITAFRKEGSSWIPETMTKHYLRKGSWASDYGLPYTDDPAFGASAKPRSHGSVSLERDFSSDDGSH